LQLRPGSIRVINLNALLQRRVEYYDYPWAIEGRLLSHALRNSNRLVRLRTKF